MSDISKSFGAVQALSQVDLVVRAGEVHSLLGENGAGKSTLLKILAGEHASDTGVVRICGTEVNLASAAAARSSGIRTVYQEPEIVPYVTVAENVYLGRLSRHGRWVNRTRLENQVDADIDRLGFGGLVRAADWGGDLSPAQCQIVEILRALVEEVKIIAFDEPTSSLSGHEVTILFRLIGSLRDADVGIIYVSHRMNEIFAVADRATVLRDGRTVATKTLSQTTKDELIRLMVGRELSARHRREPRQQHDVALSVRGLSTADVHDISFDVHAGEVVALSGLIGAGRTELAHAIVGDTAVHSGEVTVSGHRVKLDSPSRTVAAGIGLVPEERKAQALLLRSSVRENVTLAVLASLSRLHFVRRGQERALARRYTQRLRVRATSIEAAVDTLSGGNQQKVVLARWLARHPKVLILDEPTRGIDVGAKADIYDVIDELAASGMAVLVISSELPEVITLADRILVMQGGRITGEVDGASATEEQLLTLAMPPSSPAQEEPST